MTLHLHRAQRTDLLADALGELLAQPLEDTFATELVLVPARGVERWLSQQLSHRLGRGEASDGVCQRVTGRSLGESLERVHRLPPKLRTLPPARDTGRPSLPR